MSFRKEMLRPGDLLFYRPKARYMLGSWFITWMQNVAGKSPISGVSYSHVAIVDWDTEYVVESRWPKSRRWKIDWKSLDKHYTVELWRVKKVTKKEVTDALNWAHNNLGQWYDLGLFIWGTFDFMNAEVCSTFVAKAWAAAGRVFKVYKRIGKIQDFWSPDELIYNTDILKRIG